MFLRSRFYYAVLIVALVLIGGQAWAPLFVVGKVMLALLVVAVMAEIAVLWHRRGITAERHCSTRFSNGDDNTVELAIASTYSFAARLHIIDEIPHVFQRRDVGFDAKLPPNGSTTITYQLRPTKRGAYGFGRIRVFARTPLALLERRYSLGEPLEVAVYPSYMALNKYELLAMNNLKDFGAKRVRRVGNSTEFDQIKDYVQGDDFRTINWKATARRTHLMVNVYTAERSQQVLSLIDMGRVMQQAFNGMTLLDYSINASLVISHVAVRKDDNVGLIAFDAEVSDFVPPRSHASHMQMILQHLYAQTTYFDESDYSSLCVFVESQVRKRSLLILYTNFLSFGSMQRQLPYLRQLSRKHLLLVVFFDDVQLKEFIASKALTTEDHYQHVIAEKIDYERRLIVSTLRENGILSVLTTPENLNIDLINKYLEIKMRHLI